VHENDPVTSAEAKVRVGVAKICLTAKITGLATYGQPNILASYALILTAHIQLLNANFW
jgi:hypothetical protein